MISTLHTQSSNGARSSSPRSSAVADRRSRDGRDSPSTRPTREAEAHSEGSVARAIEGQTAKLPSDAFLWAALASMGVSLGMKVAGKKEGSLFVGQWAAPLLVLGVYNKLVKIGGSDRVHDR